MKTIAISLILLVVAVICIAVIATNIYNPSICESKGGHLKMVVIKPLIFKCEINK